MSLRGFSALISALAQLNIDLLKQDIIVMFQTIQQVFYSMNGITIYPHCISPNNY